MEDPIPLDNGKRIEFHLLQEDTKQIIYCYSSLQFNKSALMKKGENIELNGKCVNDPETDELVSFVFDSFIKKQKPIWSIATKLGAFAGKKANKSFSSLVLK